PTRGRLLADSPNRGNMTAISMFNGAARRADGSPDVDTGNGFLMRQGYSVLSVAIQWDPPESPERMRAWFPEALDNGQRITGPNFVQWWPNRETSQQLLSDAGHKPYATADVNDASAVLTRREYQDAPPSVIPREQWRFAKLVDGAPQPDAEHVWLDGGFQPGYVYELCYTAIGAPVIGLGFLAYRDGTSFFKYASEAQGNPLAGAIDHAYAWGQSMNGRWLRELLYLGLNRDEAGRQVFEGMLPHIGSSRRGEFNLRFGQPSTNILRAPGNTYPFAFEATPEPVIEQNRGLLDRTRANGCMPKIIQVNSGMEYWWSGASLGHTTIDGTRDLDPPDDAHVYYIAGSQHAPGALPLSDRTVDGFEAQQPLNTLDYRPAMRALLSALDLWVREGVEPPANRVPRVDNGTAVSRESLEAQYTRIPGSAWVTHLPQRLRLDYGPDADNGHPVYPSQESGAYQVLVSAMDEDGNEVAGIRLPDVAAPLATYTGWNVRGAAMGQAGLMTSGSPLFGATLPLPATRQARQASGDPRRAIEERYASKDAYLQRVRETAQSLVAERYLLEEDVSRCLDVAAAKWDAFHG
ncbi:MAG TPA: alpha/beta hydrolase domain-containing protein, partial [Dehalococcoidia bacterium]|nr:alpha/beta hydrolase domain-containing protein [Dehalococcoidia bacterium]